MAVGVTARQYVQASPLSAAEGNERSLDTIFVAIDVETTGLEAGADEIIEVAAVSFRGAEVLDTFQRLVRPRHSLPIKIAQLTGIAEAELAGAQPFHEVAPELVRFVKSYPVVGHSVGFDIRMLGAQGLRLAQPSYDTFELATLLLPGQASYNLGALAAALQIPHPDAHRALADADVARQLFTLLVQRIETLDDTTLGEIVKLSGDTRWSPRQLFEAVARERAFRAFQNPLPSAQPDEHGVNWRGVKPLESTGSRGRLDPDDVRRFFAADGPLEHVFAGYEQREQQLDMTLEVTRALNDGGTLLVEAPTGTGKSMAYLVPAARFAAERGQRVVVSTNTINLQDQLYFKDIPALQRAVDGAVLRDFGVEAQPFDAALLKGRGNYLCLHRYGRLRRLGQHTPEQAQALIKVGLWLKQTETGDRAELAMDEHEARVWPELNVTVDTCTGPHCPEFERCYFFGARRKAEAAHLVVVNHALLLSDVKADSQVLPRYDHLVIDEAHHLEDVATDQLGWRLDHLTLLRYLDDLWAVGGARLVSGLLAELPNYFKGSAATPGDIDKAEGYAAALRPLIERARQASYELWRLLRDAIERFSKENGYEQRVRVTPAVRKAQAWANTQAAWEQLMLPLAELGRGMQHLEAHIKGLEGAGLVEYDELLLRLGMMSNWAVDTAIDGAKVIFGDSEGIQWIAFERQRDLLTLNAAPLHVGPLLEAKLFTAKQTVVLARRRCRLTARSAMSQPARPRAGARPAAAARLAVRLPALDAAVFARRHARAERAHLPARAGGRDRGAGNRHRRAHAGAVYFQRCAAPDLSRHQEPLEEQEIVVLGQGLDGSRRSMLQRFREHPRTVLLGTSSFWEGVDIVGDALSVLVIAKLPFAVPSDPVFAARSELFDDPFNELLGAAVDPELQARLRPA